MINLKNKTGFSLMEVIVVTIILATALALAVPRYTRNVDVRRRREAEIQLRSIHAQQQIHYANTAHGAAQAGYFAFGGEDVSCEFGVGQINSQLKLSIFETDGIIYLCQGLGDDQLFQCTATHPNGMVITITQNPIDANNPSCIGYCPQ